MLVSQRDPKNVLVLLFIVRGLTLEMKMERIQYKSIQIYIVKPKAIANYCIKIASIRKPYKSHCILSTTVMVHYKETFLKCSTWQGFACR